MEVDALGGVTRRLETLVPSTPGGNVVLTLDAQLQRRARTRWRRRWRRAKSGQAALVALQPQTGEVLAMVSLPQYDNNLFAAGISQNDYQALSEDKNRPLVNHALGGQYPPGSTFKMVTAAAALQEKVVTAQQRINCPGYINVSGTVFTDWKEGGHGNVAVRQALGTSCDIYFWSLAGGNSAYAGLGGVRIDRLAEYARHFGFGEKTGLRLAGEAAGLIPSRELKKQRGEQWYVGDDYNVGIGQGDLLATPLQLANMTAALANGGTLYRPRLVKEVRDADGTVAADLPAGGAAQGPGRPRAPGGDPGRDARRRGHHRRDGALGAAPGDGAGGREDRIGGVRPRGVRRPQPLRQAAHPRPVRRLRAV